MYKSSLDSEAIAFARDNLGESEDVARDSVIKMQKFLEDNPSIHGRSDPRYLMLFLRSCKFDLEQVENKLRNHYKQRAERIEWFTYRDPHLAELSELLSVGVFLPLQQKDAANRQIVIIRTAAHDPSKHKQTDVFKIGRMILDYIVSADELMSVYGIRAIFDMQGVSLGHALQMTPTIIKRAVNSWESYPLRIKKLEFVNANFGINVVLDIFRSFMTSKMKERVSVTRGKLEFVESDNLPSDLGGNVGSYQSIAQHWKEVLEKNKKWFDDDEKYKSEI